MAGNSGARYGGLLTLQVLGYMLVLGGTVLLIVRFATLSSWSDDYWWGLFGAGIAVKIVGWCMVISARYQLRMMWIAQHSGAQRNYGQRTAVINPSSANYQQTPPANSVSSMAYPGAPPANVQYAYGPTAQQTSYAYGPQPVQTNYNTQYGVPPPAYAEKSDNVV